MRPDQEHARGCTSFCRRSTVAWPSSGSFSEDNDREELGGCLQAEAHVEKPAWLSFGLHALGVLGKERCRGPTRGGPGAEWSARRRLASLSARSRAASDDRRGDPARPARTRPAREPMARAPPAGAATGGPTGSGVTGIPRVAGGVGTRRAAHGRRGRRGGGRRDGLLRGARGGPELQETVDAPRWTGRQEMITPIAAGPRAAGRAPRAGEAPARRDDISWASLTARRRQSLSSGRPVGLPSPGHTGRVHILSRRPY